MNIKINKKDDIILKILHYFITEEDYKPVIINGLDNEIWLENMENDLKLIRINTNYIHNEEQFKSDIFKVKTIMKSIKRNTLSFKMTTLKDVKCGQTVRVKKIQGEGPVRRRIMDMGITKGSEIYVRKVAPLGDPVEINIRGYELTLRKFDAEMVIVE